VFGNLGGKSRQSEATGVERLAKLWRKAVKGIFDRFGLRIVRKGALDALMSQSDPFIEH